jgi:hypothetical protein
MRSVLRKPPVISTFKHLIIVEGNPIFNPIGSNILGRK